MESKDPQVPVISTTPEPELAASSRALENGDARRERAMSREESQAIRALAGDERVATILSLIPQLTDTMADEHGSCVFAALLGMCSGNSLHILLARVLSKPCLAHILSNYYGATLVIESLEKSHMARHITSFLASEFKTLMVNEFSCHLIVKCFELFDNDVNEELYKAMIRDCVELATNEVAFVAINESFEHMKQPYKDRVIVEIVSQVRLLSRNLYGSFVVQKLLELNRRELDEKIYSSLEGCFANFCMQMASSYVVAKCLDTHSGSGYVLRDLDKCNDLQLEQIVASPFGNRVLLKILARACECEDNRFLCCILTSKLYGATKNSENEDCKIFNVFLGKLRFQVDVYRLIDDLSSFRLF